MSELTPERSARSPARGDPGFEQRSPWFVAIVGLLTLGFYAAYWLWQVSRSAERFDEHRDSPFDVAKWSVPTWVTARAISLAIGATLVANVVAAQPTPEAFLDWLVPWGIAGIGVSFVAWIGLAGMVVAGWRLLKLLQVHDEAIGARDPIRPDIVLGAVALGVVTGLLLIPAVGFALYRTQTAVNRLSRAAKRGYVATPPSRHRPSRKPGARGPSSEPGGVSFQPVETE